MDSKGLEGTPGRWPEEMTRKALSRDVEETDSGRQSVGIGPSSIVIIAVAALGNGTVAGTNVRGPGFLGRRVSCGMLEIDFVSRQGNVHNTLGPKCPWCVARLSISWTTDCLPLVVMLLVFSEAKARKWQFWLQCLLPVPSFLLLGTLVAFCFKVASSYPYFLTGPVHGKEP
eukprot:Skav231123  [mRNA]  locus=scaffold7:191584:194349:+ [translate_table: standard]